MKKALLILSGVAILALMAFQLYNNKVEMAENAKLSEISSDAIPVETTKASRKILEEETTADGQLEPVTDLMVISETQGRVIRVLRKKGSTVSKGDLLAEVENDLLEAEVAATEANYLKLKADQERFSKLAEQNAVTQRQLEDIGIGLKNAEAQYKSAQKRLSNTYIRATASGFINDDFIQEGSYIGGGAKLYEIVDDQQLRLNVKLTARDILRIQKGDTVEISSNLYAGETFKGIVSAIAVKADASLKYNVEIELLNSAAQKLKPGMYTTAHFHFKQKEEALYLDRNALAGSLQNPQVFVVNGETAELKNIEVGASHGPWVEIISGLSSQDQVVSSGQINLTDGTKVKVLH
ncbi:efflux RND transporter periplasmic adaptor subunit [Croceimicrobium hydrocarbonivorans]|uniref:Efflux RND transporter periplasmic adaptor subunit n=1 Tax=Croceimicrobium hydrocarbonivorans TaxID=2761580 RepID=A0A7H0VA28_9FLAO|nr:efflux RND transporter periplasmic adaptor subunit [Croceimicrobium hydrocarbonivorans]QNR22576.1 efflux RND transporter periplasmic adaptor subunit [Croceimicrobium hydrocarbonivorans]